MPTTTRRGNKDGGASDKEGGTEEIEEKDTKIVTHWDFSLSFIQWRQIAKWLYLRVFRSILFYFIISNINNDATLQKSWQSVLVGK